MTNQDIIDVAMRQSAVDLNCSPQDFRKTENVVVVSGKNENARKYLTLPFDCNLVTYGNNIVASVREGFEDVVQVYVG